MKNIDMVVDYNMPEYYMDDYYTRAEVDMVRMQLTFEFEKRETKMYEKIEKLENLVEKLQQHINELENAIKYIPGGVEYTNAKDDFDKLIQK